MVMENINGKMEEDILENGKIIIWKVKVLILGWMEENMLVLI